MGAWILDYLNLDYLIHASGANMLSLISKKVEFRAKSCSLTFLIKYKQMLVATIKISIFCVFGDTNPNILASLLN